MKTTQAISKDISHILQQTAYTKTPKAEFVNMQPIGDFRGSKNKVRFKGNNK